MGAIVGGLYVGGHVGGRDGRASSRRRLADAVLRPAAAARTLGPPQRRMRSTRSRSRSASATFRSGSRPGALSGQNLELAAARAHLAQRRHRELRQAARFRFAPSRPTWSTARRSSSTAARCTSRCAPACRCRECSRRSSVDGRILGDGGLVNNLPVDVVRAMGADVVIAVNIGTPLMSRDQLSSFLGIAEQTINILTEQNVRAQLRAAHAARHADRPGSRRSLGIDFDAGANASSQLGEKAARAAADTLRRYTLPADAYAAYRVALRRPPAPADPELDFIGVSRHRVSRIRRCCRRRSASRPGRSVEPRARADAISRRCTGAATSSGSTTGSSMRPGTAQHRVRRRRKAVGSQLPALRRRPVVRHAGRQRASACALRHRRIWLERAGRAMDRTMSRSGATEPLRDRVLPAAHARPDLVRVGATAHRRHRAAERLREGDKVADYDVLDRARRRRPRLCLRHVGRVARRPAVRARARATRRWRVPSFPVTKHGLLGRRAARHASTRRTTRSSRAMACARPSAFSGTQRQDGADRSVTRGEVDIHQSIPIRRARYASISVCGPPAPTVSNRLVHQQLPPRRIPRDLRAAHARARRPVCRPRPRRLPAPDGHSARVRQHVLRGRFARDRQRVAAARARSPHPTPQGRQRVLRRRHVRSDRFYVAWGHTSRGDSTWYLLSRAAMSGESPIGSIAAAARSGIRARR